jgi:serine protein kinase
MKCDQGISELYLRLYDNRREVEYSLEEYLGKCADDPSYYASAAERMLRAIGDPVMVDTSQDPRLGRVFMNRTIPVYPGFSDFFGMEDTIERIVGFLRRAAQGFEERKQILYLLEANGGKSSLAERLMELMEEEPVCVLKAGNEISPVFESPLGLFDPVMLGPELERRYNIPVRRLTGTISPWAVKRLDEFDGDITKFTVVRMRPSRLKQICIADTEPGDENNHDVSRLVGTVDPRKVKSFSQNDPDAYSFSGGLNRTTQGLLEFVEMFKAPIEMLQPMLIATERGNYVGSEDLGGIPYQGIVFAHSNEAEWQSLKNNKNNEELIERISVVKVPRLLVTPDESIAFRRLYLEALQSAGKEAVQDAEPNVIQPRSAEFRAEPSVIRPSPPVAQAEPRVTETTETGVADIHGAAALVGITTAFWPGSVANMDHLQVLGLIAAGVIAAHWIAQLKKRLRRGRRHEGAS